MRKYKNGRRDCWCRVMMCCTLHTAHRRPVPPAHLRRQGGPLLLQPHQLLLPLLQLLLHRPQLLRGCQGCGSLCGLALSSLALPSSRCKLGLQVGNLLLRSGNTGGQPGRRAASHYAVVQCLQALTSEAEQWTGITQGEVLTATLRAPYWRRTK
jgi:hypothetical protein